MIDCNPDLRPSVESIRTLERFAVPFAVFSRDGRQTYVSDAALALLEPSALQTLQLWRQVSQAILGGPASSRRDSLPAAGRYAVVVRPIPDGGFQHAYAAVLRPTWGGSDAAETLSALGLTPRETAVARLIATGMSNKEVGVALGISVHTARRHTEQVYRKLGVSNRARVACLLSARDGIAAAVA